MNKMRLVIHDMTEDNWEKIKQNYSNDRIISDHGTIHPCIGCFSCWNKTPGQCVIRDGYENMGVLIHEASEVIVISRYTYGGFSGFVKNVFDRSLGYVLPQFEVIAGETHHKKRYTEEKPFTFVFYGHNLSTEEKESASRYVNAVCTNVRAYVKAVQFMEYDGQPVMEEPISATQPAKTVFLNGSMRSENGNSAKLALQFGSMLRQDYQIVELKKYSGKMAELLSLLAGAESIVLCTPLYVDGLPSQVIRFMEYAERCSGLLSGNIYVLANMGLYESRQLVNLFSAVKQWCHQTHCSYCGGLGVSAGELVGPLMGFIPFGFGATKAIAKGMGQLAEAIRQSKECGEIYTEPYCFPRSLYIAIANAGWNRAAKKNGIRRRDLFRQL